MTTSLDNAIITLSYDGLGQVTPPSSVAGKPVQRVLVATSACVANTWTQVGTISNLKPDKHYALVGYYAYSAQGKGLRFTHPDFGGCKPGASCGVTISQKRNLMEFKDFGELPIISGSAPLAVEVLDGTTSTPVVWVLLVQLD